MQKPEITILPAQRGWFVCSPIVGNDGRVNDLLHEEVVAWQIETVSYDGDEKKSAADPIIAGDFLPKAYVIKHPDGRYSEGCDSHSMSKPEAMDLLQSVADIWPNKSALKKPRGQQQ
jgi:hypothetical protein